MKQLTSLFIILALTSAVAFGQERQDGQDVPRSRLTLSLGDVIYMAQTQSLSSLIAKYSFLSGYWSYRSYQALFLPSLNLGATLGNYNRSLVALQDAYSGETRYVQNDNLRNTLNLSLNQNIPFTGGTVSVNTYLNRLDQFSPTDAITYNSNPINIAYYQPVFGFNSLKWQKKMEPEKFEKAKKDYLSDCESITITAATYFFDVLIAQQQLETAQKKLENVETLLSIAKARFQIGAYTQDAILQLELQQMNADMAITTCSVALQQQMLSLKSFLGLNDLCDVALIPPSTIENIAITVDDAVMRSLQNTSFSLDQKISLLQAEKAIAQAKADRGFSVTLQAQFGLTQTGQTLPDAYRNVLDQEIISLGVRIPILDWGLGKGKVKMAKSQQEIIISQVEKEIIEHKQKMVIKVVQFNAQTKQCLVSHKADSIADLRYNIALERFKNGSIGVLDMNTAQAEKDSALDTYMAEMKNFWIYYYTIRKETLYDYIGKTDIEAEFDKLIE